MSTTVFEQHENGYRLTGAVTLETAPDLLRTLPKTAGEDVSIDLSRTAGSDSALIALLLAWARKCGEQNLSLTCNNTPSELSSLIHLYGMESILSH